MLYKYIYVYVGMYVYVLGVKYKTTVNDKKNYIINFNFVIYN